MLLFNELYTITVPLLVPEPASSLYSANPPRESQRHFTASPQVDTVARARTRAG